MSRSSDCDIWKKEKEVMKIKVTQRLTYPEARKINDQQKPEFTFSKVVSSMPKKPETKTSSTQYDVKDSEITESSKVIISRIHKQNQNSQNSTSKSSSTPARKQQNQTTQILKNQNKLSYRIGLGRDLMIQSKITTDLEPWQMMVTWIPTRGLSPTVTFQASKEVVSSLFYLNKRSSTKYTLQII